MELCMGATSVAAIRRWVFAARAARWQHLISSHLGVPAPRRMAVEAWVRGGVAAGEREGCPLASTRGLGAELRTESPQGELRVRVGSARQKLRSNTYGIERSGVLLYFFTCSTEARAQWGYTCGT